jgi:hypothetical protein
MSLDWNIKQIRDYIKLYRKIGEGERGYSATQPTFTLRSESERIIWLTMIIGMREITEKNWEQFYNRVNFYEKNTDSHMWKKQKNKLVPMYITKDQVKKMIGLSTNASTLTKNQFIKKVMSEDKFDF